MKIVPNTFVIGVQKAATTSVYDWISQHPQTCGPLSLKDHPIFLPEQREIDDEAMYEEYMRVGYQESIDVVLQGWVQYIFYPESLTEIKKHCPEAKLILILRNPIDRAISAHSFLAKIKKEPLTLAAAIDAESERATLGPEEKNNFTYISHGLYAQQIKTLFKIFDPKNVLIVLYEDVNDSPQQVIKNIYRFLNIDPDFNPQFVVRNTTGTVRFDWVQNFLFAPNKFRNFLVKNLIGKVLSQPIRNRLRLFLRELNTSNKKAPMNQNGGIDRTELAVYFENDVKELEGIINRSLAHWLE